jgi:hypothetical protein
VTRRRRRRRVRLPERRAARRARKHGCRNLGGKHTPVPEPSRVLLPGDVEPGREAPEPNAGGAPRGRDAARPFVEHLWGECAAPD